MLVGWDLRWKEITIATLTTAMYTLSRNQDKKVRSLAQWSRASEDSLGKRRGAKKGFNSSGEEIEVLPSTERQESALRGD